jgi:hypothetical protein
LKQLSASQRWYSLWWVSVLTSTRVIFTNNDGKRICKRPCPQLPQAFWAILWGSTVWKGTASLRYKMPSGRDSRSPQPRLHYLKQPGVSWRLDSWSWLTTGAFQ